MSDRNVSSSAPFVRQASASRASDISLQAPLPQPHPGTVQLSDLTAQPSDLAAQRSDLAARFLSLPTAAATAAPAPGGPGRVGSMTADTMTSQPTMDVIFESLFASSAGADAAQPAAGASLHTAGGSVREMSGTIGFTQLLGILDRSSLPPGPIESFTSLPGNSGSFPQPFPAVAPHAGAASAGAGLAGRQPSAAGGLDDHRSQLNLPGRRPPNEEYDEDSEEQSLSLRPQRRAKNAGRRAIKRDADSDWEMDEEEYEPEPRERSSRSAASKEPKVNVRTSKPCIAMRCSGRSELDGLITSRKCRYGRTCTRHSTHSSTPGSRSWSQHGRHRRGSASRMPRSSRRYASRWLRTSTRTPSSQTAPLKSSAHTKWCDAAQLCLVYACRCRGRGGDKAALAGA